MHRLFMLFWTLAICLLLAGCGLDDDDTKSDDGQADDDAGDDDVADDDQTDDDLDDDTTDDDLDDDTIDDDMIDDDAVDDDSVDDDSVDDDSVDDDSVDDDSVDDDTADDDTVVVEEEYIAVGQAALQAGVSELLTWHQSQGRTVWYMDTETIASTFSGEDLPAQVRAYLQSVLDPTKRQFLLLVGSHQTLPLRWVDPDPLVPYEYECATDSYYADLNGDFDADGDGTYGEYGQDTYDWTPEMYVGRLPFDDNDTLAAVSDKIVAFAEADAAYKWDTLLAAGSIQINGDSSVIVEMIADLIVKPNGFSAYRMYEQPGFIQPDEWLTHDAFVGRLSSTPAGLVMSASHGSDVCAFAGAPFVCNVDTPNFSDEQPGVVMSSACSNADLTVVNSLGEAFLHHGAVSYVGSTAVTHPGDIGEASIVFLAMMNHTLVLNTPLGKGVADSKQLYMDTFFPLQWYDDGLYLRNFFGFTLVGDPALAYWHDSPFV